MASEYLASADETAGAAVEALAEKVRLRYGGDRVHHFYEHGQWWIRVYYDADDPYGDSDGSTELSVVDCEDEDGESRLDVEEV